MRDGKVSFCTYDGGTRRNGEWVLNVKSVIVFGRVEIVSDMERIVDITTRLSHKFTSDEEYIKEEIRLHASKTLLLVLTPEHICGKSVLES